MKLKTLHGALALGLALGLAAQARAQEAPGRLTFLAGAGVTYGGDTLVAARFTDGSRKDMKAGGLAEVYGGAEYRWSDDISIQNTIGYHGDYREAGSNAKLRFTRIPIDVLVMYRIAPNLRLGGGVQLVASPELKGTGRASSLSQKYDATAGAIVEAEYLFTPHIGMKLRYVNEKFTPKDGGDKVDGSHAGVLLSYYF